jgi:hypothetical protein
MFSEQIDLNLKPKVENTIYVMNLLNLTLRYVRKIGYKKKQLIIGYYSQY